MKLLSTLLLCLVSVGLFVAAAPTSGGHDYNDHDYNDHDHDYDDHKNKTSLRAMEHKYKRWIKKTLDSRGPNEKCNSKTVTVRQEWGSMSKKDRAAYIKAVNCLISKPTLSNLTEVPGARNRLDDFAAAHIQNSNDIHFNGNLYAWHRYFTWSYEQTLRKECGYKGAQPYWDWTLFADDPRKSPVFSGGAYSMGGNGEAIVHGATLLSAFGKQFTLPPGTGGGCIQEGPFSNLTVNLGLSPVILAPAAQAVSNNTGDIESHRLVSIAGINPALQYNPRCLKRDINLFWSNQTHTKDVEFLLSCPNVDCLEKRADGWELPADQPQPLIHAAGHFAIGGLQNDPFASPGDPVFYLHHGQFDRVWSIWQGQDPAQRLYQVGGTKTPFNTPPSDPVSLEDYLNFGAVAQPVKHRDIQSTIDGPFCYYYD